jgi:hypothetical protein
LSAPRGWSSRALTCATLMSLLIAGCKAQPRPQDDSARKGRTDSSTALRSSKGPFVTNLSALTVASGDFANDSLVRAILDSVAAGSKKGKPDMWDKKHDRMDARRLMQGDCGPESKTCVPGPYVQIIPRKNVHTNQDLGLGRVIGKLVNQETNFPYTKLALYVNTPEVYWWVGPRPGGTDTISVYVPSDWNATSKPAKWRSVTVMLTEPGNPAFRHTQSSTRFVWNDKDDETWGTCVRNGCCQPPVMFDSTAEGTARLDSNPQ